MLKGFNYPLTPKGKSSLNPPPPWYYSADFLSIEFWSDPSAVAALLPRGLDPDPSANGHGNAQFYTYTNGNATAAYSYTDTVTDNYTDADCYAKSYSEASSDTTSTPYTTRLREWRVNIKVLKSLKLISTVTMYE